MSSYKKLSKADITTTVYTANKQWNFLYPSGSLPPDDNNIIYYKGTKEYFNKTGSTTSRYQYQSLIYDSINHLFYQSYNDILDTGSLMFDINTYESASEQRPTSSYFNYNINPLLIKNYPTSSSSGIIVLSINKNIYSNKILPHSFRMSSSLFNIVDDGNGNLFHSYNCDLYELGESGFTDTFFYVTCSSNIYTTESLNTSASRNINPDYPILTISGSEAILFISRETHNFHVGNIFYAHGIAVITNQDYQNIFPPPPPPPSQSININIKGYVYEIIPNTGSVYYKIDTGSFTFLGNIYGTVCRNIGSFTAPTGSQIYIGITSASNNVGFSAAETASCIDIPVATSFCGILNPFTSSVGYFPVTSSITSSISIAAKAGGGTSSFSIC